MKKEKTNEYASLAALTGLLMVLFLWTGMQIFLYILVILALIALLVPPFRRFCRDVYQCFSRILGNCISFILLLLFFYGILTPLGLLRKISGKTAMPFRSDCRASSGFIAVNDTLSPDSFEKMW